MRDRKICLSNILHIALVGAIFLLVFWPEYFNYVPIISEYDVVVKILLVSGTALLYYVHKKKTPIITFYIVIFTIVQLMVTLFNHSYIQKALWGDGLLLLSMCGCIQWGYEYNETGFIKTLYYLFYILLLINFVTLLIFPEGMYADARGTMDTNFFLGNYNSFILYMLFAIVFGYLLHKDGTKWRPGYLFLWMLSFMTLSIKRSATSIIVLLLFGIYTFFLNYKWTRLFLNIKTYFLMNGVIFVSVVWNTNTSFLLEKITKLLNKDITFTGRTYIWSTAIQYIKKKWIWGYGCQSDAATRMTFNNVQAVHCHNLYLNILYQNGIIGLFIIFLILIIVLNRLKYLNNSKVRYFLEAYIGIFMLRRQFEAENIKVEFFMFIFIFLYCCKNKYIKHENVLK